MSVKIRLKRIGAKKNPFYRIIVADSRSPRDGRFIEEIGYYDPLTKPITVKIDNERAMNWLNNGAKPTDTVNRLFKQNGMYDAAKVEVEVEVEDESEAKIEEE